ncbi:unnamed protein product [Bursaphelenchus okinawaensis]|uniref:Uncharacterized protein n=1 Tax=Bursaphelenchus okinawaensis TaxID=465554 RepID=A0A811JU64_9BILA|nr:unnamed protein product [Bursaphelenchus okinawaensis]CAG9083232.1 unnamed protein product [Bursaphelenchus okinawaensis]
MQRKRHAPAGSFRSPITHNRTEAGSPIKKKNCQSVTPLRSGFTTPSSTIGRSSSNKCGTPVVMKISPTKQISESLQTLDFTTASQAPIKLLASKLNAAKTLLRDVDNIVTDEELLNMPVRTERPKETVPDSLDDDLDVDWESVGKLIQEKMKD